MNKIYEITTRTGRTIKVTGDHSLFGLNDEGKISELAARNLKNKEFIAVPRKMPFNNTHIKHINLLDHLDKLNKGYLVGDPIKKFLNKYKIIVHSLGKEYNHNRSSRCMWIRVGIAPIKIIKDLKSLGYCLEDAEDIYFKYSGNSKKLPIKIELDHNLLTLIGLWIADGCYDQKSIIFSVVEEENRAIVYAIANRYGFNVKFHSDTFSLMINSVTLKMVMREILELKGDSHTKRIPQWAFNLSNEQIGCILNGLFSGDGCVSDKEIIISLASFGLLRDVQTLLLNFGIIFRIGKYRERDHVYEARISALKSISNFKQEIGLLVSEKSKRLDLLCQKSSTHDVTDVIPLSLNFKKRFKKLYSSFNYKDYVYGAESNFGRVKLGNLMSQIEINDGLFHDLKLLASSDLFWDQIKEIKTYSLKNEYVYDVSVPENESFVANNIVAHNTLELPTEAMRKLGFNIQPMKVRSALTKGGSEVEADEGIRTSLRMGDSALIVGEIRSTEALALYESMRIGALANVVAGTIHGDSPYGVFDRVVNDLKVPRTSFKATDIIIISNPILSADGLHRWRRVLSITEVRKQWEEDPLREAGFIDLMKYNPLTDELEPTPDLINGESEILKSIASNVKGWAGNWDAVWDNVMLRAKIKKTLVDYSIKTELPQLLEAGFVVLSNDQFHRLFEEVQSETDRLDNDKLFFMWEEWLKKEIRKMMGLV